MQTDALFFSFPNEDAMLDVAEQLAKITENGMTIFLYGPLGAGKTTFTRGFLRGLGYKEKVKSPTYTLVEPYEVSDKKIFHFDFYRIQNINELEQIGIRDYFSKTSICLVEWPEIGLTLLPPPDLAIYFSFKEAGREMRIAAYSLRGAEILRKLNQKG